MNTAIMAKSEVISTAKQLRERLGGTIFAFPTEENNPFSPYAVVVYAGGKFFVYPSAIDISEAATGVLTIMKEFQKIGMATNYEKDVRLVSYQSQMDAPSVVMRRLKKANSGGLK